MIRLLGPRPFKEKDDFMDQYFGGPRDTQGNGSGIAKPPGIPAIENENVPPPQKPGDGPPDLAPTTFEKDNLPRL